MDVDREQLERQVREAFHGGEVRRREMRLTGEEAGYLARQYHARVLPRGDGWYEISFGGMEDE